MTLIADSAGAEYAAMRLALPHLSFRTMQASDAAELHISASTPAARAAVRAYLNFLQERWKIGR
jgi:hypothetical protein